MPINRGILSFFGWRNKKLEARINSYSTSSPEERYEIQEIVLYGGTHRELKLLMRQIVSLYNCGTAKERRAIEDWFKQCGNFNALNVLQVGFVTRTIK